MLIQCTTFLSHSFPFQGQISLFLVRPASESLTQLKVRSSARHSERGGLDAAALSAVASRSAAVSFQTQEITVHSAQDGSGDGAKVGVSPGATVTPGATPGATVAPGATVGATPSATPGCTAGATDSARTKRTKQSQDTFPLSQVRAKPDSPGQRHWTAQGPPSRDLLQSQLAKFIEMQVQSHMCKASGGQPLSVQEEAPGRVHRLDH